MEAGKIALDLTNMHAHEFYGTRNGLRIMDRPSPINGKRDMEYGLSVVGHFHVGQSCLSHIDPSWLKTIRGNS